MHIVNSCPHFKRQYIGIGVRLLLFNTVGVCHCSVIRHCIVRWCAHFFFQRLERFHKLLLHVVGHIYILISHLRIDWLLLLPRRSRNKVIVVFAKFRILRDRNHATQRTPVLCILATELWPLGCQRICCIWNMERRRWLLSISLSDRKAVCNVAVRADRNFLTHVRHLHIWVFHEAVLYLMVRNTVLATLLLCFCFLLKYLMLFL